MARIRFHHFAWGVLAYNLVVILGGAFVRASVSGDGCGAHWPDCHGQLIPHTGRLATIIEFSHRLSTGVLLPLIAVLLVWAFRAFRPGHPARTSAVFVLILTLVEAGIGAGLVLYRLVAHDQSPSRAIVMPAHLIVTFLLLMALALTAWWGGGGARVRIRDQGGLSWALGAGLLAVLALGISGAIAALGDTLFPARSLMEGLRQDLDPAAHFLLGLRLYHPLIAITVGLYVTLVAGLCLRLRPDADVQRFARATLILYGVQIGAGFLNLGLLAPIWMQLIHLLLADFFWVSLVLLSATALAEGVPQVRLDSLRADVARPPATWRDYVALTKPRVISLLLFTALTAMLIAAGGEGARWPGIGLYLCVGIGFYMAAGAANAINMVLERDLDLRMGRTAKRPIVTNAISPRAALVFALAMMVGSFAILWMAANLLSAMLALAGLAFYVVVYTLLLKRRTWANIVIGGAAGAFPPLIGWSAVTGDLSPLAWCLFGIIFLWTPVHFWALAIMLKEDYARAGVPMLPVVRGVPATVAQIAFYTVLTIGFTAVPVLLHGRDGQAAVGWFYGVAAILLNGALLWRSLRLRQQPDRPRALALFHYSMVYLALLFLAMAIDRTPWI